MVKVNDTSCHAIGDEVFIDNDDNKLKILSDLLHLIYFKNVQLESKKSYFKFAILNKL